MLQLTGEVVVGKIPQLTCLAIKFIHKNLVLLAFSARPTTFERF